jgi:uncharacterized protein (TIRG00374 family)
MAAVDSNVGSPSGAPPARWRQRAVTSGSIAISVVSLYIALRGADIGQIVTTLRQARLWIALPLLLLHLPFYILKAERWRLLLEPVRRARTRDLLPPMMIGFMGNNVLPARLGELIRMYLGARALDVAQSQVLATLILERIFDFIGVLVLLAAGGLLLTNVPAVIVSAGYIAAAISVIAIGGALAYVMFTDWVVRVASVATRVLPDGIANAVRRQLELGATGMASLRDWRLLLAIVGNSVLQWLIMACCIYVSCQAVGIQAPLPVAFIVLAATVFAIVVPAAPGFFGTLHLSFVLALTPFGVDGTRAFAAAVFYHIFPYLAVILTGLFYVRQSGLRFHQLDVARAAKAIG